MGRIDVRSKERGIELPTPPVPVASSVGVVEIGDLLLQGRLGPRQPR